MDRYRYFLKLAYDGTAYHGWQSQENAETVQMMLNNALQLILRELADVTGAGRTDAGVHAREYFAHFEIGRKLTKKEREKTLFQLNGFLPQDIAIYDLMPVRPDAHARFSATSRTYEYHITLHKDPFRREYTYHLYGDLDLRLMNRGARILLETDDFTSFSKVDTDAKTNLCKVTEAHWQRKGDELIFTISANRFLRNMVRAIVGTLLELGRHRIDLEGFKRIIESKNRSNAGGSVPARGLYLTRVVYPGEIFI
jgi:tRNA pseudouridine38-40 synthase